MEINIKYVEERDVDHLIIRNVQKSILFKKLFLSKIISSQNDFDVSKICQSVENDLGESDIVIYGNTSKGPYQIHIEDKIDADAQKDQYKRYVKRCERELKDKKIIGYTICLIAPQDYLDHETQPYPKKVSYQEIYELLDLSCADEIDKRIIKMAIDKNTNHSAIKVVDDNKTVFWSKYYEYIKKNHFYLYGKYNETEQKGNESVWHRFNKTNINGVQIVAKYNKCCVDIQLANMNNNIKKIYDKFGKFLEDDVSVLKSSKSAFIRFEIPYIDFSSVFENQIANIEAALKVIENAFKLLRKLEANGLNSSPF